MLKPCVFKNSHCVAHYQYVNVAIIDFALVMKTADVCNPYLTLSSEWKQSLCKYLNDYIEMTCYCLIKKSPLFANAVASFPPLHWKSRNALPYKPTPCWKVNINKTPYWLDLY